MTPVPRRSMLAAAAAALAMVVLPSVAWGHAALVKSSPRAGSVVSTAMAQVRLEFSEDVDPELCHVALMAGNQSHIELRVVGDARNRRVILAAVSSLTPGEYRVMWHAVSADGHPSAGQFRFSVAGKKSDARAIPPVAASRADTPASMKYSDGENRFPAFAAITKGIGVSALLALGGALFFSLGHGRAREREYRRWTLALAVVATAALIVHAVLWAQYVMAPAGFSRAELMTVFERGPGRMEMVRLIIVVCALLSLLVGLTAPLVLALTGMAIGVTAAIGHPLAEHPALSIPLIILHLGAVAIWSGGLISLLVVRNVEPALFRTHASLVSTLALLAVIVVSATGVAESLLVLTSPSDLFLSSYGRWIVAKVAGLLVLMLFGWHHRFRALPGLTNDEPHRMTLSLRMEFAVMAATILAAAFLSYTPIPR